MDYRSPIDDFLFTLRHGAGVERLPHWEEETARQVLAESARFIEGEIAPLDPVGDATPAQLVDGRVRVAPRFVSAYASYRDAGWGGLAVAAEYGGQELPHVLAAVISEMLAGACASFQMIVSLAHGAMRAITANGSPQQCARYMPLLASGEWLATMCLTEPQAGSDLGLISTLAEPAADGGWRITGSKIFISGGDQNMTDNILHLVLARTPGAARGVKGLSLFLCPAALADGQRNAVSCVRLEEKLGLHASPTCQMAFDGARAELLGAEGQGLAHMFVMMNAQRLDVAVQATGLAEIAGQRSRAYAAERRQGRAGDLPSPAPIQRHADVRRMLLTQMALTEGCRALILRTCVTLELGDNPALVDFLTPVCKAFTTDCAVEAAQLAIQIHGGYGYLREYRVEQILRDARITQIYEGTNGIQAATLADRVLRLNNAEAAKAFRAEIAAALALAPGATADALSVALAHWEAAVTALLKRHAAGAGATRFMRLTGLVAVGAAWARLEAAADAAPRPQRTLAAAAFFRDWLLPECGILAESLMNYTDFAAEPEEVFA
ncbi:MAG: acyl-CoA dehydrogenase [Proteobacteria bacterium]|nr:acyl-CoA dehydrogenase [Pseudomonadota bacterium]